MFWQQVTRDQEVTDFRFFVRCIIRHYDLVTRDASFDYLESEGERTVMEALDALASGLRDTWHWAEAEEIYNRALAIDPESSELLEDISEFYLMLFTFQKIKQIQ